LAPADPILEAGIMLASALFALGTSLSLLPGRRPGHDPALPSALTCLWEWLAPDQPPLSIAAHRGSDRWLADAAIAVLDRIWELQRWSSAEQFNAVVARLRRSGLSRDTASTVAVITALNEAKRAEASHEPTADVVAQLLPTGGSGRVDEEARWLANLARTRQLCLQPSHRAHTHHGNEAPPRAGVNCPDPDMLQRCEQLLAQWFPARRPATVAEIQAAVGRRRGRSIDVVIGDPEGLPVPTALWLREQDKDVIWLDRNTSELQKLAAFGHEVAHMMCQHQPVMVNPRDSQVLERVLGPGGEGRQLAYMGRCKPGISAVDDPIEAEAELLGRLLTARLMYAPGSGAAFLDHA
jgi:hypothetical protein